MKAVTYTKTDTNDQAIYKTAKQRLLNKGNTIVILSVCWYTRAQPLRRQNKTSRSYNLHFSSQRRCLHKIYRYQNAIMSLPYSVKQFQLKHGWSMYGSLSTVYQGQVGHRAKPPSDRSERKITEHCFRFSLARHLHLQIDEKVSLMNEN